ncbi:MAG: VOC family protein [Yoonia sp.]|nr:VOC family protein [Yoonia sp.]MDG1862551.1 VOC family protein [Yoonia sp.]
MNIKPYLFFNGTARDAITHYAKVFGVEIPPLMTMEDAPPGMDLPPERRNWIMHCELTIGDSGIYLSDDAAANSPAMEGASMMVSLATAKEAKRIFDGLAEGGTIRMPWEPTFWSAGFGTLTDQFGIRWMVGTDEAPK